MSMERCSQCDETKDSDFFEFEDGLCESCIVLNKLGNEWNKLNQNPIQSKINAQENFCKKNKVPNFTSSDGICFSCKKQIFNSITKEKAETEHITGCPFCCRSFCD